MYLGPRHKTKALLRTLIVFGLLLCIFLWLKMRIPNPPFPEEGGGGPGMGLEVNLGMDNEGMGDNQMPEPIHMPDFKEAQTTPEPDAEKLITDDSEESENIESSEKKEPEIKKKKEKQIKKNIDKVIPEKIAKVEKEVKTTPKVNQKALFPSKKTTSNEGNTGKPGDQGNPNGVAGSPLYTGGGNGSGNGTGGGSGSGTGPNKGDGISFFLNGRNPSYLPKPEFNDQIEGKVVVEITVDKNGKVISAVPGVKGSTTLDETLLDAAKKAALLSRFDKKPDATVQKGTITYHFLLQ
jgi:TonB family protein